MGLIRSIVWGKRPLPSRQEFKYAMLRGEFAIIIIIVGVFYICLDTFNGVKVFLPWYTLMIAMAVTSMLFNRWQQYTLSNLIILFIINFLVYIFADVDHPNGGVFFYFMTSSMAGLILFNNYKSTAGLFFALLPVVLGCLAFFTDLNLLPHPVYTESMIGINFIANFTIGLLSTFFMLHFLLNQNQESEQTLVEQNELLEKANKELDHFVYSVSHDLRAPLSSILGLTNIYQLSGDENEKAAIVKMISERANALDNFIGEVLDYSRNARVELKLEPVNVWGLVDEVRKGMLHMDGVQDVTIDIRVDPGLMVSTDRERIKVILNNLVSNAIHYRDPGKKPTLVIESSIMAEYWIIVVKDNGIGIKKEHHERIFDMFYKAHDRAHGTGLGLYIVKETIQRLGADIQVESEYAVGSTFIVKIPFR